MMQSLRTILAPQGVSVHSILTGNVDTDMTKGFDMEKSPPEVVAHGVFDGIEKDQDEIFPDPMSATLADYWNNGSSKELERRFAAMYAHLTQQG